MYIAENVENKLWDTYSLPYTHAKKPIFKPMTELVSKWKGTKRFLKMNISEIKKESTAVASSSIKLRNADDVMNLEHDSDDSDYEDNLPLIHVREGLKDILQGESPIGLRTRKRLHEKNVVLCEKQGEILYLEDYERVSGEVNEKSRTLNEEALVLGCRKKHKKSKVTQKEACNEQVFTNRNVNDSIQTSTPNKLKGFKECYIDLSPISKDVLSNLIHYGD